MPSKALFGIEAIRQTLREEVERTSVRAVASDVGMSASGLLLVLGRSKPHPATMKKLVAWYTEYRRGRKRTVASVLAEDVDAAAMLLGHYLSTTDRDEVRRRRFREPVGRIAPQSGLATADALASDSHAAGDGGTTRTK